MRENSNNKIAVLKKMIGTGEEVVAENVYMVPHNSSVNVKPKLGGCESKPIENSTQHLTQLQVCKCQHCENMAKNFLYLESLIRSNTNATHNNCRVCHSSLQYLQFVNKSIMKVFGSYDSVVEAAKAFGLKVKSKAKLNTARNSHSEKSKSSNHGIAKPKPLSQIKKRVTTSKIFKTSKKVVEKSLPLKNLSKNSVVSAKKSNKSKMKNDTSDHSTLNDGSSKKRSKPSKVKKLKGLNIKTKSLIHKPPKSKN